jgi:hypothetical protein
MNVLSKIVSPQERGRGERYLVVGTLLYWRERMKGDSFHQGRKTILFQDLVKKILQVQVLEVFVKVRHIVP